MVLQNEEQMDGQIDRAELIDPPAEAQVQKY